MDTMRPCRGDFLRTCQGLQRESRCVANTVQRVHLSRAVGYAAFLADEKFRIVAVIPGLSAVSFPGCVNVCTSTVGTSTL